MLTTLRALYNNITAQAYGFRLRDIQKREVAPLNPKRPTLRRLRADLTRAVYAFLQSQAPVMARQIGAQLDARGLRKADFTEAELDAIEAIVAGIDFAGWAVLVGDIDGMLADIVRDGTVAAFAQIGIDVEARREVFNVVNDFAVQYGRQRSAAMVGMRVDALGGVIPNPNAKWRITDATRTGLRALIREAIEQGWSNDTLAKKIADAYAFSKERSMVIARTETIRASNYGSLESYRASGVVSGKRWLTAEDDKVTPDCVANGEAGVIALDAAFPSGEVAPPDHPNCRCTIAPVVDWTKLDNIPSLTEH